MDSRNVFVVGVLLRSVWRRRNVSQYVLGLRKQVMSVPCAKVVIPKSHGKAEAFQVGQGEFRRGI